MNRAVRFLAEDYFLPLLCRIWGIRDPLDLSVYVSPIYWVFTSSSCSCRRSSSYYPIKFMMGKSIVECINFVAHLCKFMTSGSDNNTRESGAKYTKSPLNSWGLGAPRAWGMEPVEQALCLTAGGARDGIYRLGISRLHQSYNQLC